jgi:cytochrome c biogenesis protein CcdA
VTGSLAPIVAGIVPDRWPYYLTIGMVATVNPCGFAMLPAYLAYFLGLEGSHDDEPQATVPQAMRVAAAVAAGFLAVFAVAGAAVELTSLPVNETTAWVSIVIGIGLFVLGAAMLLGFELTLRLPRLDRGGRQRTLGSMFVFGVSYAIASVGCTLPVFMIAVVGTFRSESVASGLAVFGLYGLGMTLVLLALTVGIALARTSMVRFLRGAMPYVGRVSGGLVALAGAYVTYYGWLEVRLGADGAVSGSNVSRTVTGWSDSVSTWVESVGAGRIAVVLAILLTGVLLAVRAARTPAPGAGSPDGATPSDDAVEDDRAPAEAADPSRSPTG